MWPETHEHIHVIREACRRIRVRELERWGTSGLWAAGNGRVHRRCVRGEVVHDLVENDELGVGRRSGAQTLQQLDTGRVWPVVQNIPDEKY